MRLIGAAPLVLLACSAAAQTGPIDLAMGCRAAIAVEFGRDPRTMSVSRRGSLVALSYVRPDDQTTWRLMCRQGETGPAGTRIEWAAVQENGSIGRWRNDGVYDMIIIVRRDGSNVVAQMDMPNGGTIRTRTYPIASLQGQGRR